MNALQLCCWKFSYRETFFKRTAILHGKRPFYFFEPPLEGLGATYNVHRRLIGKLMVDFLLVLIELLC